MLGKATLGISQKDPRPNYLLLALITFFVLFPYYWMVITSLKPATELMLTPPSWFPSRLELGNYIEVWGTLPLFKYLCNSLFIAIGTTAFCLILAAFAGYSLSRFQTKIKKLSVTLIVFSQLVPGVLPFIAYYFVVFNLKLTNTYQGLILTYAIWGIPFCTLMMRSYFSAAIPKSLEECAIIDGCSRLGVFFKIAIPISIPGIVATAIFAFILAWNEFMFASVILTNNDLKPVSVGIFDYVGQYGATISTSMAMATATITTLPAIILFGFMQKYLISGLTSGAVKG